MKEAYRPLFSLLDDISQRLTRLADLAEKKIEAVHEDDLMKLNEILNEEQAETLAFRNLELRRVKLLTELGLEGTSLSSLPERCPAELRSEASLRVDRVQEQYRSYKEAADRARGLLESSIGQIDAILASAGQTPENGPGYGGDSSTPPPNMKTDFRA